MAYLGNVPARSFISFEKQVFTIVNSQTAYTLSHSVTNENDIRLVINNVVQEPGSGKAYTASGTTLTLSAALTNGTDEMYCVFLGRAVGTVNAPAGSVAASQLASDSVTAAKLNDDIISGQTELATAPADTDEFLVSDAGTIKRIDYSLIKGGIDMVDQFSLTADHSGDSVITSNLARSSHTAFGRIGTGMSESSGIFTFPSTGIYLIIPKIVFRTDNSGDRTMTCYTEVTTDNSSYTNVDAIFSGAEDTDGLATNTTSSSFCFIDVTDTSNVKVRFRTESIDANLEGAESTYNMTTFTFIRLGDT